MMKIKVLGMMRMSILGRVNRFELHKRVIIAYLGLIKYILWFHQVSMASEWTCLCYYEPHNQSMKSKVESKESIYQKNVRPLSSDDDDDFFSPIQSLLFIKYNIVNY